jgi:hypothetical protein
VQKIKCRAHNTPLLLPERWRLAPSSREYAQLRCQCGALRRIMWFDCHGSHTHSTVQLARYHWHGIKDMTTGRSVAVILMPRGQQRKRHPSRAMDPGQHHFARRVRSTWLLIDVEVTVCNLISHPPPQQRLRTTAAVRTRAACFYMSARAATASHQTPKQNKRCQLLQLRRMSLQALLTHCDVRPIIHSAAIVLLAAQCLLCSQRDSLEPWAATSSWLPPRCLRCCCCCCCCSCCCCRC